MPTCFIMRAEREPRVIWETKLPVPHLIQVVGNQKNHK